jgi:hypothetical protein
MSYLRDTVVKVNVFNNRSNEELVIKRERLNTRLYLVIVTIALVITILYATLEQHRFSVRIKLSSLIEFQKWQVKYTQTLHCPCLQTAIEYQNFINLSQPLFHQICSSDFVTSEWNEYLIDAVYGSQYGKPSSIDAQFQSLIQLKLLTSFCQLASQTIVDLSEVFLTTKFVTAQMITERQFTSQIQSIIELFQQSTVANAFRQAYYVSRDLIHASQIASMYQTTWQFFIDYNYNASGLGVLSAFPLVYHNLTDGTNCNCATTVGCAAQVCTN